MYGPSAESLMVQVVILQCIIWELLETNAEIEDDGKLHVKMRKSNVSRQSVSGLGLGGNGGVGSFSGLTPRPSNLSGTEIYILSSSWNPTPRGWNLKLADFYSMMGVQGFGSGQGQRV
ncbi:unnamed protein product [Linum trigynum]|uniref:Uncharacterized protein n=1 Tax=Linum trigynum TaxID=586398 RepID=A0AAV2E4H4_9ROSI